MSVPSSAEELVQLIRKSGMVDDQVLNGYIQRRELARGLPEDVREFAEDMIRDGVITNFQAEQFLLGKWRGFTIGKYKLLERVGVGGMGQVFLCEHMFMKRRVAIKVLPPAKAEQPAALGRFYREARAAGSLHHTNIVRTQDIDQDGNLHFIVMEYVDGADLLVIVKKFGPLDIRRATHYIRQAALGLDFAFRNGIIHRDVKPGNVLIDRKGRARLLDLGLARFYKDQNDQLTLKYDDKIVLGTADYVAPEQVANSHSVDIRADIYGLGATFYFILAGHPPFPMGTVSQKLLWHRTKEPTPIRQIRPEIPEGLAAIVAKMMAKDPKARFQTPAQVAAELERWIDAAGVPLPAAEEMPTLSPAATSVVNSMGFEEDEVVVQPSASAAAPPPMAAPVSAMAATTNKPSAGRTSTKERTATLTPPPRKDASSPPASPFSTGAVAAPVKPPSINPFSSPSTTPAVDTPKLKPIQVGVETGFHEADPTPSPGHRARKRPDNPFSGGDATRAKAKNESQWLMIGVLIGASILGGAIAALTVGGVKAPVNSPTEKR